MLTNGLDLYFYVQDVQGTWINLFLQPDALSTNEVEAHEEYLRMTCRYVSDNLDTLKCFLYNTCTTKLIDELNISVDHADGDKHAYTPSNHQQNKARGLCRFECDQLPQNIGTVLGSGVPNELLAAECGPDCPQESRWSESCGVPVSARTIYRR